MICPYCEANNNHVTDSRWSPSKFVTRRRYHCDTCKNRFTTHEGYNTKTRHDILKFRDIRRKEKL